MRSRPYINLYFNHIEDKFLKSPLTKELINDLLYELTFRRATKDVQNLQVKLNKALTNLSSKKVVLDDDMELGKRVKYAAQQKRTPKTNISVKTIAKFEGEKVYLPLDIIKRFSLEENTKINAIPF